MKTQAKGDAYNACIKFNWVSQKTKVSGEHLDFMALYVSASRKTNISEYLVVKKTFYQVLTYKTAYPTQWIITAANFYWVLPRFWTLAQHFDLVFWFKCLLTPVNGAHTVRYGQSFFAHFLCRRAPNAWGQGGGRPEALAALLSQGACLSGAPPPWPTRTNWGLRR